MDEYELQAENFLQKCNAGIAFKYLGKMQPIFGGVARNAFQCVISTPRGNMQVTFFDSLYNTHKRPYGKYEPSAYDVISCLQKYDVGGMQDFFAEFYGKIESVEEMTQFLNTYNACQKEYADICRIFTAEQIEEMRTIQ